MQLMYTHNDVIHLVCTCTLVYSHYSYGRLPTYNWSGVWYKNSGSFWSENQTTDLGHSGPGKISVLLVVMHDCISLALYMYIR